VGMVAGEHIRGWRMESRAGGQDGIPVFKHIKLMKISTVQKGRISHYFDAICSLNKLHLRRNLNDKKSLRFSLIQCI
jgi:hypothetical protein